MVKEDDGTRLLKLEESSSWTKQVRRDYKPTWKGEPSFPWAGWCFRVGKHLGEAGWTIESHQPSKMVSVAPPPGKTGYIPCKLLQWLYSGCFMKANVGCSSVEAATLFNLCKDLDKKDIMPAIVFNFSRTTKGVLSWIPVHFRGFKRGMPQTREGKTEFVMDSLKEEPRV